MLLLAFVLAAPLGAVALAANCGKSAAGFSTWLEQFKTEAVAEGISKRTLDRGLKGVSYHRRVIQLDRGQKSFKLSFKAFYARRVSNAMINKGRRLIKQYASTLAGIEKRYGVPAPVIISIWGLETGYGRDSGKFDIIRSLATLAYDCRRSDFFRKELVAALKIVQRGDMTPGQLRGGWAGEIGQTQFLASSYYKYAVDFNGDGRRDLIRSVPDLLASTANYLRVKGWQRGQGWGPGSSNYGVIREWNRASVYVQTIAVMANRMAGKS
jgi:lytic murein transglycosylase